VECPSEFQGNVLASVNQRRGLIMSAAEDGVFTTVEAEVPLAEMFGYVTALRSLSSGRATSSLEFSHYAQTPKDVMENVIYKIKGYLVTV
jgi:elongation factor G